jgi:adenine-specific DNA-methyltransferase
LKTKLQDLINKFKSNIKHYKSSNFDETSTRTTFINPLLEILGWDTTDHTQVIHEAKQKVEGKTKAPDYALVHQGKRLLYVEAKKPSVDIHDGKAPAFQIKRYAYSAKLPVSIVTDFEEFAIYDTIKKPNENDKANISRIFFCTYEEYLLPLSKEDSKRFQKEYDLTFEFNFDLIEHFFSKDNAYNGSLDVFKKKIKKGHKTIDDEILSDVEKWRTKLAENIARHNKNLDIYQLNEAVQKIIDRIIFLRMAEDRDTEEYEYLKKLVTQKDVYSHLVEYFHQSNVKYNSGLFSSEYWLDGLKISNVVFKEMVHDLYYPKPYEFSILPIETLGHIYEQFLGKMISLNEKHQAVIELKPEVRKAGGVYYTPEYIVQYIVENTIGEKIKGKRPNDIESLTVLDPACGSGSFLIGAYEYLLDYHLEYYKKNTKVSIRNKKIYDAGSGEYKLTFREKRNILLNNIYGVDIDSQAVEVTKLSLLLKMMEGEMMESNNELFTQTEGILPNLENNIKCGNSLIGSDFRNGNEELFKDYDKRRKVNVFDWDGERGFKKIMDSGGFDCVIGNPPYIQIQKLVASSKESVEYIKAKYEETSSDNNIDIYIPFIHRGVGKLINDDGILGYICPNRFFNSDYGLKLRKFLLNYNVKHIVNFRHYFVFENADTYTTMLFIGKGKQEKIKYREIDNLYKNEDSRVQDILSKKSSLSLIHSDVLKNENWYFMSSEERTLFDKLLKDNNSLSKIYKDFFVGIQTSKDSVYILKLIDKNINTSILYSKYLNSNVEIENDILLHIISDPDIKNYYIDSSDNYYVIFPYNNGKLFSSNHISNNFPLGWDYLNQCKTELENREKGKFKNTWWQYGRNQNIDKQDYIKLLIPHVVKEMRCAFDESGEYAIKNVGVNGITLRESVQEDPKYILALLNSKIATFVISKVSIFLSGGYYASNKQFANHIPIRTIDFTNPTEKVQHDKLVELVEQMLEAQKQLHGGKLKTETEKQFAREDVEYIDKQIDQLVYELYDLTEEEIKIIEDSTK